MSFGRPLPTFPYPAKFVVKTIDVDTMAVYDGWGKIQNRGVPVTMVDWACDNLKPGRDYPQRIVVEAEDVEWGDDIAHVSKYTKLELYGKINRTHNKPLFVVDEHKASGSLHSVDIELTGTCLLDGGGTGKTETMIELDNIKGCVNLVHGLGFKNFASPLIHMQGTSGAKFFYNTLHHLRVSADIIASFGASGKSLFTFDKHAIDNFLINVQGSVSSLTGNYPYGVHMKGGGNWMDHVHIDELMSLVWVEFTEEQMSPGPDIVHCYPDRCKGHGILIDNTAEEGGTDGNIIDNFFMRIPDNFDLVHYIAGSGGDLNDWEIVLNRSVSAPTPHEWCWNTEDSTRVNRLTLFNSWADGDTGRNNNTGNSPYLIGRDAP